MSHREGLPRTIIESLFMCTPILCYNVIGCNEIVIDEFNGKIVDIRIENSPQVDILIDIGIPIIARITRKSLSELQLTKGTKLFTMVKAVAIDKKSIGHIKNNTTSTV